MTHGECVGVRLPLDVELEVESIAATCGYTRSTVMRKLVAGGVRHVREQSETIGDLVIALNRWSKCK
jgi:hypothetical protein